jgi:hypothetical protein
MKQVEYLEGEEQQRGVEKAMAALFSPKPSAVPKQAPQAPAQSSPER